MADDNGATGHSPTVSQVIDRFAEAMRADPDIPDDAVDRLEALLCKATVPKPDDINSAVFPPPA